MKMKHSQTEIDLVTVYR